MNTARKLTLKELSQLPLASVVWAEFREEVTVNDGGTTLPGCYYISVTPFVVSGADGEGGFLTGSILENDGSFPVTFEVFEEGFNSGLFSPDYRGELPTFWSEKPDADMVSPGITQKQFDTMNDEELLQAFGYSSLDNVPKQDAPSVTASPKTGSTPGEKLSDEDNLIIALASVAAKMNDEQLALLLRIADLIKDRPDRRQYAMDYTGKMKDLPAILETI